MAARNRRALAPGRALGWRGLAHVWPEILAGGRARSADKDGRPSTRAWAKDGEQHLIGIAGEAAYADYMGLPMDWKVRPEGDGGVEDFEGGVQVKAVPYRGEAFDYHLKEDPELRSKGWPEFYVLAVMDMARQRAAFLGWCDADRVRRGRVEDYGYGPRLVVGAADLEPMEFYPPMFEALFGRVPGDVHIPTYPHLPGGTT